MPSIYRHLTSLLLGMTPLLACACGKPVPTTNAGPATTPVIATDPTSGASPLLAMLPQTDENDWPWWRGPGLDNRAVEQDVPLTWSDVQQKEDGETEGEAENIVWKSAISGRGLSSPSLWGEQIFLTTADEEQGTVHLLCYDRISGNLRWDRMLHEGGLLTTHTKNSQASQTPACDGSMVYVPHVVKHDGQSGVWVSAVDLAGEIVWQTKAGDFTSLHGYGASPVLYGSLVIVAGDNGKSGFLAAIERSSGKVRWRVDRKKDYSFATPTVAHVAGRDQLLLHGTLMVVSYDPQTGEEMWRCNGLSVSAANTMVADNERVYASGGWPEKVLLAIRADGSGDVTETHVEWKTDRTKICYVPSMLLHDGLLYGINDDGIGHCYEAATGDVVWKERVPGNFSASPTLVGDRLYIPNEAGKMYVLKAGREFEILAENDLGDGGFATPVIVGGRIYLRTDHHLYCIGQE